MSRLGIFLTLDTETILAIQQKAVSLLLEGKTTISWTGEGSGAAKAFAMPISDVLEECKYALCSLDPATYGNLLIQIKPIHA